MKLLTQSEKLRNHALILHRELEGILTLLGGMDERTRKESTELKERITSSSKLSLREISSFLTAKIKRHRDYYGIKVSREEILEILGWFEVLRGTGKYLFIPKHFIKNLFDRFDRVFPRFNDFPDHCRIGVDTELIQERKKGSAFFLMEATIFTDMCALFNQAIEIRVRIKEKETSQPAVSLPELPRLEDVPVKSISEVAAELLRRIPPEVLEIKELQRQLSALSRSAVIYALFFVEAYLNGTAFDYFMKSKETLDKDERAVLTEWDEEKNRPRYQDLRSKILRYTRIILGREHSPLTEENCPEILTLCERGKSIRDAIVHASPFSSPKNGSWNKEHELINLKFQEAERIVDSSISLVKRVEREIHGSTAGLFWLYERDKKDGRFPKECFV